MSYHQPPLPVLQRSCDTLEDSDDFECGSYVENSLLEDFRTLQVAFTGVQDILMEGDKHVAKERERFISSIEADLQENLQAELVAVSSYVIELLGTIENLQGKVNSLQTLLNKYKKKLELLEHKESVH
jgi:peptidoglycan hydrolase CwlO-like protein